MIAIAIYAIAIAIAIAISIAISIAIVIAIAIYAIAIYAVVIAIYAVGFSTTARLQRSQLCFEWIGSIQCRRRCSLCSFATHRSLSFSAISLESAWTLG